MRQSTVRRPARRADLFPKLAFHEDRGRVAAHWKINGYPAEILIWTADEWDRLKVRPDDARYHPSGVWCALRLR